jgi:hypothetical protein
MRVNNIFMSMFRRFTIASAPRPTIQPRPISELQDDLLYIPEQHTPDAVQLPVGVDIFGIDAVEREMMFHRRRAASSAQTLSPRDLGRLQAGGSRSTSHLHPAKHKRMNFTDDMQSHPETSSLLRRNEPVQTVSIVQEDAVPEVVPETEVVEQPSPRPPPQTQLVQDLEEQYYLKGVDWWDMTTGEPRQVRIVTQNENGPCPLIALANVLVLRGELVMPERKHVTGDQLVMLLADKLVELLAHFEAANPDQERLKQSNLEHQFVISAALNHLHSLKHGLNIDLHFDSSRKFSPTPEIAVFQALNIELVHGWCVDSQEEASVWDVLLRRHVTSYEKVTELVVRADWTSSNRTTEPEEETLIHDGLILRDFMDRNSTQLTQHGLYVLAQSLPPAGLAVFFRNNHFATLFKHPINEQLYLLVTDAGYLSRGNVVWELLADVEGHASELLDADFGPLVPEQPQPPTEPATPRVDSE